MHLPSRAGVAAHPNCSPGRRMPVRCTSIKPYRLCICVYESCFQASVLIWLIASLDAALINSAASRQMGAGGSKAAARTYQAAEATAAKAAAQRAAVSASGALARDGEGPSNQNLYEAFAFLALRLGRWLRAVASWCGMAA